MLSQEELKQILYYNEETGIFTRLISCGGKFKGSVAGTLSNGYISIEIQGVTYKAHRLAWLYKKGYIPEGLIDHRDRIKHHNWWDNLREASNQCNSRNSKIYSTNTSGVKGISWHKNSEKWVSYIYFNNKRKSLGTFVDFHEAVAHRLAAEQCLNWDGCDSSSSAYKYMR